MAALRGERFFLDLDSDDDNDGAHSVQPQATSIFLGLIKDIKERSTDSSSNPPVAPNHNQSANGFPIHKKRAPASRFKQERQAQTATDSGPAMADDSISFFQRERREIDRENKKRLAQMPENTIVEEQQDLIHGLPQSLIQRLLQRTTIESPPTEYSSHTGPSNAKLTVERNRTASETALGASRIGKTRQRIVFDTTQGETTGSKFCQTDLNYSSSASNDSASAIHFPLPMQPPSLDSNSATFLTDLHDKYFPDLTADPSKLAWMSEPNTHEINSYSTCVDSLPVSALRFSFAGALLPPSVSVSIPTTAGLHHHGDSPAAAGYTIAELAHLSRSSFPSQRCIAFQTLGRLLYRLGKGEFGHGEEGQGLERGLWGCIIDGKVLETLQEAVSRNKGHISSIAYAVDALWLWQQGGGKEPDEITAD